jgi:hypothetical protein
MMGYDGISFGSPVMSSFTGTPYCWFRRSPHSGRWMS